MHRVEEARFELTKRLDVRNGGAEFPVGTAKAVNERLPRILVDGARKNSNPEIANGANPVEVLAVAGDLTRGMHHHRAVGWATVTAVEARSDADEEEEHRVLKAVRWIVEWIVLIRNLVWRDDPDVR